jgi:hypothetical protein
MTTWVMHCIAVKLRTMFSWTRAARGHSPTVALPKVETMIDMSIEMIRSMEPRSGPDEYTAREPLRAIIAIRSAVVRRNLVVSVRTNRGFSDADPNLRGGVMGGSHK